MGTWRFVKQEKAMMNGGWFCETCGMNLTEKTAIGHHFPVYKSRGGKDVVSNCVIHCIRCEREEHSHDLNKRGDCNELPKRRRGSSNKSKREFVTLPNMRGEEPSAYYRKVKADRPMYRM